MAGVRPSIVLQILYTKLYAARAASVPPVAIVAVAGVSEPCARSVKPTAIVASPTFASHHCAPASLGACSVSTMMATTGGMAG